MYTLGCRSLILATNHNPLAGILNECRLDPIENPRMLKLKEKTLAFEFSIVYVKGGSNAIKTADALSRHAVHCKEDNRHFDAKETVAQAHGVHQASAVESVT